MRALALQENKKLTTLEMPEPPSPERGQVKLAISCFTLNHLDVYSYRGMMFAKRDFPLVVGLEAAGRVVECGADVEGLETGDLVAIYGGGVCGACSPCLSGIENACESPTGVMGFHFDGVAREYLNIDADLVMKVSKGVSAAEAACASVGFATAEHMLFDNAKLLSGETVLVHAAGSGIGSSAIRLAKAVGAKVIATVGSDEKIEKAIAIGADHVLNYQAGRFDRKIRQLTNKRGVDVVFEHTGAATWQGSLMSMARGGRLVTCGATSGSHVEMDLLYLFNMQLKILASFGSTIKNMRDALDKMATGIKPIIDSEIALEDYADGLKRLQNREVFGKIVVRIQ